MLNKIWFWLLFIGIVFGAGKGIYYASNGEYPPGLAPQAVSAVSPTPTDRPVDSSKTVDGNDGKSPSAAEILRASGQQLTEEALESAEVAVTLCITLIGVMTLWLGLMNIAKDAGLVDALARVMQPAMRWLFPDVPKGHPAQGSMLMNLSANLLGMGNAATPFGLKAMEDLDLLNQHKGTCTNAMAMFLAINTSSVTLIPITVIGLRIGTGSTNAAAPMAGLLMATTISTITAIIATKILCKLPRYALPETANTVQNNESKVKKEANDE